MNQPPTMYIHQVYTQFFRLQWYGGEVAGYASFAPVFCLATKRCVNLGPSFLYASPPSCKQQYLRLDSVGRRYAIGWHKSGCRRTPVHSRPMPTTTDASVVMSTVNPKALQSPWNSKTYVMEALHPEHARVSRHFRGIFALRLKPLTPRDISWYISH